MLTLEHKTEEKVCFEGLVKLQNRRVIDPTQDIPLVHQDASLLAFNDLAFF